MNESAEVGPRGRPRDPRADEAILRAALELFTEHGPDATSIEQVAKRAGVARLTVYRRWPNKEALLLAAVDQARELDDSTLYQSLLETETEPSADELDAAVDRILEAVVRTISRPEQRRLLTRLIGTASSHPELLRTFWHSYLSPRRRLARTAIRRAVELGGLPANTDPELFMDTIVGATLLPTLLYPESPSEQELRDRMRAVFNQLLVQRQGETATTANPTSESSDVKHACHTVNRVRELRTARGLSQAGLAAALGVSRQTVNAVETGRYTPSLPLALALARSFETSVEALFDTEASQKTTR